MKKLLLTLLISTMITAIGISQNLTLSDANGPIANNGTITVQGDVDNPILAHVYVTNNSTSTINVRVKKEYISIVPGSSNYFCWGNCYASDVFISGITVPISAGATDNSNFEGDYAANGNAGTSTVKYTFYDDSDTTNAVAVNVEYEATLVGINELLDDVVFSEAYPNPATNQVSFNYSLPSGINEAQVIIRDILGSTVATRLITNQEGKITMNTENLTNGMYFYSIIVNENIVSSRKLVINR